MKECVAIWMWTNALKLLRQLALGSIIYLWNGSLADKFVINLHIISASSAVFCSKLFSLIDFNWFETIYDTLSEFVANLQRKLKTNHRISISKLTTHVSCLLFHFEISPESALWRESKQTHSPIEWARFVENYYEPILKHVLERNFQRKKAKSFPGDH